MRHRVAGRKLGRVRRQRTALVRSLLTALILHERIETTEAKAKTLKPHIEKLMTTAKLGSLAAKQRLLKELYNNQIVVKKMTQVLAPRYKDRVGGYVRVVKKGFRAGDAAPVAIIEFV
ncbi:TPA: 50S ribosomal protein L17 [Patescibacteria group bacterium]|uniref:Large ribosomal subunit protein bL17 n=2 Tax=Bacteria division Kazan-3B-28 TaxID=1798534 RepID=A0A0G1X6Z1_UNCK3|nr:MAG: 50S ribosomal protein L17 [candidate division Kazan bacterium GW2011_GWA1_50_15]KKW25425.1 MAG: 50S ribosomal protein L17 [candidate division Kazan bacterium GW2011_GWC1_52_13]KKW26731.1 MAG: 50S ribosomal protein L17 [candidate division Kazan bacterium GW2011_GWB1_52_7]HAV65729.1 50S ribosomal protein L17 [Patescibacteria group bacterium]HCL47591.1 50S ribosomal protein L17 [Patescibacteria group bacterium]